MIAWDRNCTNSFWLCPGYCHQRWCYYSHPHSHLERKTSLDLRSCVECIHYQAPNVFLRTYNSPAKRSNSFRYLNFLGSLNVSDQDFWHLNGILFSTIYRYPNKFCTNIATWIFHKNVTWIKGYDFLVGAILLNMTNLLAFSQYDLPLLFTKVVLVCTKAFFPFLGMYPNPCLFKVNFWLAQQWLNLALLS